MAYYKNRIKKDVSKFEFTADSYTISDDILNQYNTLKSLYHKTISYMTQYKNGCNINSESTSNKKTECNANILTQFKVMLEFYESARIYISMLLEEIFKNPIDKKRELLILLDKTFKIFYVFDICRYQNPSMFHAFAIYKDKANDEALTCKITAFSAISMPMAHLFMSYFRLDNDEIHVPTELIKRCPIFLSDAKKEHLYFLACLTCRYGDFLYCRIFFCGLFNRFFQSSHFLMYIERLNEQKQAYYALLAEFI
ncbi:hypothetical protein BDAP_002213 [Binucleata daphniae]